MYYNIPHAKQTQDSEVVGWTWTQCMQTQQQSNQTLCNRPFTSGQWQCQADLWLSHKCLFSQPLHLKLLWRPTSFKSATATVLANSLTPPPHLFLFKFTDVLCVCVCVRAHVHTCVRACECVCIVGLASLVMWIAGSYCYCCFLLGVSQHGCC